MNTRDPFNIRRTTPLPFANLRAAATVAATTATVAASQTLEVAREKGVRAVEQLKEAAQDLREKAEEWEFPEFREGKREERDSSGGLERGAPEYTGREREFEERRSPTKDGDTNTADMSFAVPRNVPNFDTGSQRRFEDGMWGKFTGSSDTGLPMYKDKPTGGKVYGYSSRTGGRSVKKWVQGKRGLGVLAAFVLTIFWWLGIFSSGGGSGVVKEGESLGHVVKGGWGSGVGGGKKGKVDWGVRQKAVREAFLASWKGYTEHGWGKQYSASSSLR